MNILENNANSFRIFKTPFIRIFENSFNDKGFPYCKISKFNVSVNKMNVLRILSLAILTNTFCQLIIKYFIVHNVPERANFIICEFNILPFALCSLYHFNTKNPTSFHKFFMLMLFSVNIFLICMFDIRLKNL